MESREKIAGGRLRQGCRQLADDFRSLEDKPGFLLLFLTAFLMLLAYEMVRPVSNGTLNAAWGATGLPYAWILTAFLGIPVIGVFNRLLGRLGVARIFSAVALLVTGLTFFFSWWLTAAPKPSSLLLYSWKDIYILLLVEQIWALANATYSDRQAKLLYGWFTASGSLGAMAGAWLVKTYTPVVGAIGMLNFSALPHLLLLGSFLLTVRRSRGVTNTREMSPGSSARAAPLFRPDSGLALFREYRFLPWLPILVSLVQLLVSLTDFNLNCFVQNAFADVDSRTTYLASVYLRINELAFFLQFVVMAPALRWYGVFRTHLTIPALLGVGFVVLFLYPQVALAGMLFVFLKASDYSILRGAREVLYLPVSLEAKYKAKSIIDVYVYRAAKVLSSFLLLFLKSLQGELTQIVSGVLILASFLWCLVIPVLKRRWEELSFRREAD